MEEELRFEYVTEEGLEEFWRLRDRYMLEDIVPNSEPATTDEEKEWFFSKEYRDDIEEAFRRERYQLKIVYLYKDVQYAGFIVYVIYNFEDGKCFVLEYCIEKSQREAGLGTRAFKQFEQFVKPQGAAYFALNNSNERNRKFWRSLGFVKGEADEWGNPVYVRK